MWKTVFYEFCKQRASPQQRGFLSQSKYPVLHQGAFGGMGFLFLGRLGSQASTEKKASGLIISNSFLYTGRAAQTAQKQKSHTTKSPLLQDWVFRL